MLDFLRIFSSFYSASSPAGADVTIGSTRPLKKNKEKEKNTVSCKHSLHAPTRFTDVPLSAGNASANGHLQPLDPQLTMTLGYGVGVVMVREGVPIYSLGYQPYPAPTHMQALGVPVAIAAQTNLQPPQA